MGLFDIFRRKASAPIATTQPEPPYSLRTTAVPEGVIPHVRYGEAPWETWVDRWETTGHPEWYVATKNDYGSYDIIRTVGGGYEVTVAEFQPLDKMVDFLLKKEIRAMEKYKGFHDLKIGQLVDYIDGGGFEKGSLLKHLHEKPALLEGYLERNITNYKARTPREILYHKISQEIKKVTAAHDAGPYTPDDLKKYIASHSFPEGHVFNLVKKNPAVLDTYLQDTYPGHYANKPQIVEPKPAGLRPAPAG